MSKSERAIQKDFELGFARNADLIKKQVLLELIQITSVCENYHEFRNAMYSIALGYLEEFEKQGLVPPGTADAQRKKSDSTK